MGRDRYERGKCEAKLNRMMQKCGKHMRITAMTDDVVLNKLENGEVDNIKDLLAVQKLYGDRVALAMGEATERADVTFEIVNYESDNNLNDAN